LNTIVVLDEDLSKWRKYRVWAIPLSVIIDKNKKVCGFDTLDKVALRNLINGAAEIRIGFPSFEERFPSIDL
jgi:hypothetical protein